jgi:hypothetical protein
MCSGGLVTLACVAILEIYLIFWVSLGNVIHETEKKDKNTL